MAKSDAFEKWCPVKITDPAKAPKAVALVNAYRHAWDAALEEAAKVARAEIGATRREIADAILALKSSAQKEKA